MLLVTFPLDQYLIKHSLFWPPSLVLVHHRYRTPSPTPLFRCPGIFCKCPFLLFCLKLCNFQRASARAHHTRCYCYSDIPSMASSSVSQEDFDNDFELTSRRSRIRNARARVGLPRTGDASSINFQSTRNDKSATAPSISIQRYFKSGTTLFSGNRPNTEELQGVCDASSNNVLPPEHENQQTKPIMRKQDKRVTGR